ncbi:MAG TPA: TlpA disulfide reductase family protein [Terriglobia bacterium]
MNPRKTLLLALGLILLIVLSGWLTKRARQAEVAADEGDDSPLTGSVAPDFTLKALDGRVVKLSDYRGKKTVVLAFWASWCGPCRLEMPLLESFYRQNRNPNVELLAVSIDQDPEAARHYAEANKLPFPVLIDDRGQAADSYQAYGIPILFVVDPAGKVLHSHAGLNPAIETVLEAELGAKL